MFVNKYSHISDEYNLKVCAVIMRNLRHTIFLCEGKDTCRFSDVHYCNFKDLYKIFTLRFFEITQRKTQKLEA